MTVADNKKSRVGSIARACKIVKRMSPNANKSELCYYDLLTTYYTRLQEAEQNGKFIAAHTVFFPVEILYAMDLVPLHTESTMMISTLFLGNQSDYLAAGSELKLAPEICSAHRSLAGAYALGALPRPDVMLWSNLICDNSAKSGELLSELNHCPRFFLEHPFGDSPEEEKYLIAELEDLISFLEEQSGHKMNWDRLSEYIANMNQEIALFLEVQELRKAVPSPFYNRGYLEFLAADYLFPGQPEAINYLQIVRDELADLVKQGKGAVQPEKFRIMSLFVPPLYLIGSLDKIFQENGAVSVTEPFFNYWPEFKLDPAKPLESIAKKFMITPERRMMYGPLGDTTINELIKCAKDYKVDGAVYYAYIGCRQTCATIKLFKDVLNKIDVPVLTLDIDLIDPTVNTQSEIQQKLEQFFELLQDR